MHLKRALAPMLLALAWGCNLPPSPAPAWEGPCRNDEDCLFSGADVGKVCKEGLCEFSAAEGAAAPNFCLPVINPASEHYGGNHCLAQEKEQVVLLFFGLIA